MTRKEFYRQFLHLYYDSMGELIGVRPPTAQERDLAWEEAKVQIIKITEQGDDPRAWGQFRRMFESGKDEHSL